MTHLKFDYILDINNLPHNVLTFNPVKMTITINLESIGKTKKQENILR